MNLNLLILKLVLHFGRTIDVFNSTLNSLAIKDSVFQITISLNRISSSIYLLFDHLVLLKRLSFLGKQNERSYINLSQRFLLFALAMNLTRDLYEINNFINSYKSKKRNVLHKNTILKSSTDSELIELTWSEYYSLFKINRHITVDTIKNLFDFLICYSSLQKPDQKYDAKLVSLLGIASSLLGLLPIIKYSYRLSP